MLERIMIDQLKAIFGFEKVTFDKPSESQEQRAIFVKVDKAYSRVVDQREIHRANGSITVYAPNDEMPYGYFAKALARADESITKGWFFGVEEPLGTFRNLLARSMEFQFLFDGQYDPALGNITSIDLSYPET